MQGFILRIRLASAGAAKTGADSIVLSGGYVDDQDHGTVIVYTGHGGRDQNTGKQAKSQTLTLGNLGLATSHIIGLSQVEQQSEQYTEGLPADIPHAEFPLPFAYESTGKETYFWKTGQTGHLWSEHAWSYNPAGTVHFMFASYPLACNNPAPAQVDEEIIVWQI